MNSTHPLIALCNQMWLIFIQGRSLDSSFALVYGKMSVIVTGDVNTAIIVPFSYIYCLITSVIKATSPTLLQIYDLIVFVVEFVLFSLTVPVARIDCDVSFCMSPWLLKNCQRIVHDVEVLSIVEQH